MISIIESCLPVHLVSSSVSLLCWDRPLESSHCKIKHQPSESPTRIAFQDKDLTSCLVFIPGFFSYILNLVLWYKLLHICQNTHFSSLKLCPPPFLWLTCIQVLHIIRNDASTFFLCKNAVDFFKHRKQMFSTFCVYNINQILIH